MKLDFRYVLWGADFDGDVFDFFSSVFLHMIDGSFDFIGKPLNNTVSNKEIIRTLGFVLEQVDQFWQYALDAIDLFDFCPSFASICVGGFRILFIIKMQLGFIFQFVCNGFLSSPKNRNTKASVVFFTIVSSVNLIRAKRVEFISARIACKVFFCNKC